MLADLKIVEDKLFLPEALEEFSQVRIPSLRNIRYRNWLHSWTKHQKKKQDSASGDTSQRYHRLTTTAISCSPASLNKTVSFHWLREEEGVHQVRKLVAQRRIFCPATAETLRCARLNLKQSSHGPRPPQNDRLWIRPQTGQTVQRTIRSRLSKVLVSFQSTNFERPRRRIRIFWRWSWTDGRHWYSGTDEILVNRSQYRHNWRKMLQFCGKLAEPCTESLQYWRHPSEDGFGANNLSFGRWSWNCQASQIAQSVEADRKRRQRCGPIILREKVLIAAFGGPCCAGPLHDQS